MSLEFTLPWCISWANYLQPGTRNEIVGSTLIFKSTTLASTTLDQKLNWYDRVRDTSFFKRTTSY